MGDLTPDATISGGAGANTLKVSGQGIVQPKLSQFQTVELNGISGETILSGKNASDLTNVSIKGAGIAAHTVTLDGIATPALNVSVAGAQGAGTVQLTSATDLTYSTSATAAGVKAKTAEVVNTKVSAAEATNATINVGAYTSQAGAINVGKATAVTLNVASGKDAATPAVEQTSFDATLSAANAQSVTVNALGSLGTSAVINAGAATLANITATGGGTLKLDMAKAQQVNITAGAALNIKGSVLTAAESVTVAANAGKTDASDVNLGKINTLNLSGTGATGAVHVGNLGSADISNPITVNVSGLKLGATIGTIDTKGGNVTVNAATAMRHGFRRW